MVKSAHRDDAWLLSARLAPAASAPDPLANLAAVVVSTPRNAPLPKLKSARIGALARANSSASTTFCMVLSPLPPYSAGHDAQIQPPAKSFDGHSSLNVFFCSGVISKPSSNQPSGRFSSSHDRISVRNSSASAG